MAFGLAGLEPVDMVVGAGNAHLAEANASSTAGYTGGLSVARFLRPLTYQRVDEDQATNAMAEAVVAISRAEGLVAHGATAAKRMQRVHAT